MRKKTKSTRKSSSKASWGAAKALMAKDDRTRPSLDHFRGGSRGSSR